MLGKCKNLNNHLDSVVTNYQMFYKNLKLYIEIKNRSEHCVIQKEYKIENECRYIINRSVNYDLTQAVLLRCICEFCVLLGACILSGVSIISFIITSVERKLFELSKFCGCQRFERLGPCTRLCVQRQDGARLRVLFGGLQLS